MPIQGEVVDGGPVSVAVDHQAAAVLAQHLVYRLRSPSMMIWLFWAFSIWLWPRILWAMAWRRERQAQEEPAQPLLLGDAAKLLVASSGCRADPRGSAAPARRTAR
jgi:hypothetical protein